MQRESSRGEQLLCEDGNGESEVVAVWFLRDETAEMIAASVIKFISDNPEAGRVRIIMADKDFVEREAFSAAFPDANIHICFFHTLRTFCDLFRCTWTLSRRRERGRCACNIST